MRALIYCIIFGVVVLFSGCAYNVQPQVSAATNIYSSYSEKIPGRYVVVIDSSMNDIHRDIKASSYVCSGPTYPIDMGNVLAASIMGTLDQVFHETIEQSDMPTAEMLKRLDSVGTVFVRLDDFSPRLTCTQGFWSGNCTADTDITFGVQVRDPNGMIYATSVDSEKSSSGDAGQACNGGATVLERSIKKATRDAMNRMAERLSNSDRLRKISKQLVEK